MSETELQIARARIDELERLVEDLRPIIIYTSSVGDEYREALQRLAKCCGECRDCRARAQAALDGQDRQAHIRGAKSLWDTCLVLRQQLTFAQRSIDMHRELIAEQSPQQTNAEVAGVPTAAVTEKTKPLLEMLQKAQLNWKQLLDERDELYKLVSVLQEAFGGDVVNWGTDYLCLPLEAGLQLQEALGHWLDFQSSR